MDGDIPNNVPARIMPVKTNWRLLTGGILRVALIRYTSLFGLKYSSQWESSSCR